MIRLPRDVCVHLFRRTPEGPHYLMLRRCPARGGFWQGVTGAPLAGETDAQAAVREVREETGFDVADTLIPLDVWYAYARMQGAVPVTSFGAEVPGADPALDPQEHDAFRWCSYAAAYALLEWPVEADALSGRRRALGVLDARVGCTLG